MGSATEAGTEGKQSCAQKGLVSPHKQMPHFYGSGPPEGPPRIDTELASNRPRIDHESTLDRPQIAPQEAGPPWEEPVGCSAGTSFGAGTVRHALPEKRAARCPCRGWMSAKGHQDGARGRHIRELIKRVGPTMHQDWQGRLNVPAEQELESNTPGTGLGQAKWPANQPLPD